MAAPLPTNDILGVFKALKDDIQTSILNPRGLSIKSAGTKALTLTEPTNTLKGFWDNPNSVSNKPPRWIVQVEGQPTGGALARFALDATTGQPIAMGKTVGYANNRDGSCAVMAFRVLPAVKLASASSSWEFPQGWEFLLIIGFDKPLPAGTSGDPLSDFNPLSGSIDFGGGAAKRTYKIAFRALVKVPGALPSASSGMTYNDCALAVAGLAGATVYDGTQPIDRDLLVADLSSVFATSPPTGPFVLAEDTNLVGIDPSTYKEIEAAVNSGKRHVIFYGPPGTGKTTLAEYLAREC